MYMHVYIHTYIYIYIHTRTYIDRPYPGVYTHIRTCYICMCICMYMYIHTYTYIYTLVCIWTDHNDVGILARDECLFCIACISKSYRQEYIQVRPVCVIEREVLCVCMYMYLYIHVCIRILYLSPICFS